MGVRVFIECAYLSHALVEVRCVTLNAHLFDERVKSAKDSDVKRRGLGEDDLRYYLLSTVGTA